MSGETFTGRAWVFGDDVDTDALAPGRYMHRPVEELAAHCLEDVDSDFAANVAPGDVVIGGRNFGVGSSREQAAQALKLRGVAGVVARSFAGIFHRNALNLGLPVLTGDASAVAAGTGVRLDLEGARLLHSGGTVALEPVPGFLLALLRDLRMLASINAGFDPIPIRRRMRPYGVVVGMFRRMD